MIKKKIMLVFGTRPEAIKMAPLVHALKNQSKKFDIQVCLTSQHRHMLDQVLNTFKLKPDIDLKLMKPNQSLSELSASILVKMHKVLTLYKPEAVLVHGDTTTSLATAMASFYASIPVGHVEAGLRTYNLNSPFPEEFNRQVTSKITNWHFVPTNLSKQNLLKEGYPEDKIFITGNTVVDALYWVLKKIKENKIKQNYLERSLKAVLPLNLSSERFILVTAHRRENFGDRFLEICSAIKELALTNSSMYFVYPVHLNPKVIEPVQKILGNLKNVYLIKPQDYESFIYLLSHAYMVLTDSGGIQEEAPSLGKPVLVMRESTERPEAVKAGTVKLVGSQKNEIINSVMRLFNDDNYYQKMSMAHNPYGDGNACNRIVDILRQI